MTGSVAVRNKGRHLPGWSSEEESDSEEPSFNGVTQAPSAGSNAKTHTIGMEKYDFFTYVACIVVFLEPLFRFYSSHSFKDIFIEVRF